MVEDLTLPEMLAMSHKVYNWEQSRIPTWANDYNGKVGDFYIALGKKEESYSISLSICACEIGDFIDIGVYTGSDTLLADEYGRVSQILKQEADERYMNKLADVRRHMHSTKSDGGELTLTEMLALADAIPVEDWHYQTNKLEDGATKVEYRATINIQPDSIFENPHIIVSSQDPKRAVFTLEVDCQGMFRQLHTPLGLYTGSDHQVAELYTLLSKYYEKKINEVQVIYLEMARKLVKTPTEGSILRQSLQNISNHLNNLRKQ